MANIMQEQTVTPSSQTVQAEHVPRLQAILVPVRPRRPRNTSANVIRGSTCRVNVAPLIFSVIGAGPGPATGKALPFAPSVVPMRVDLGSVTVAPGILGVETANKPAA